MTTRLERSVAVPASRVYEALLDAEAVAQWMVPDGMTSVIHEFEPREGGAFRISLTYDDPAAVGKTSAQTDSFHGRFTQLDPGRQVVQEVEFETDDPSMRGVMTISYILREEAGTTVVTGLHENLPPGLSPEDNALGWRQSMDKLARLLEGGPAG